MFAQLLYKLVGTKNERELKRIRPLVDRINAFEPALRACSDADLAAKTPHFKERVARGESLDALLPEAFAVVREASQRTLRMRPFDVQLIGGAFLHEGKIAEMKTGEGKTLAATLPVYLNALAGKGVHVITVNDYLARRDAEWMMPIYKMLGLTVGVIVHDMSDTERAWAYRADCTYGTNNEFGFDYLRDNMKYNLEQYVQRELHYAIVDEVDSILIDEARTPLIISGPAEQSTQLYYQVNQIMPFLHKEDHFTVDEKARSVLLTDAGVKLCEQRLQVENLYDPRHITILHHVNQALRAHALFQRDVDYVVKDDQILIVDEFTGRLMPGRRWSDGLHQAVEAKEGVRIENENQTLATITFQNFFRMYHKLAGMTGTADTEASEFAKIYNLEVAVIPTNQPMIREDRHDQIYKSEAAKCQAVVEELRECQTRGQPVLIGTISIEKSEEISQLLKKAGMAHHVLNAKQHEREAEIVAQAGRKGAVTISTNMAGRGTDIKLGGNPEAMARARVGAQGTEAEYQAMLQRFVTECGVEREEVVAAGGLYILGTERHESRRIDNQLRGRSGRQGDPGASRFYLSLDDNLLRVFGGDRIKNMMERMGMQEDEVIEHRWLNRAIENAQKRVEERNFSIRKNLLEYDDIMNQQRQQIYSRRRAILGQADVSDLVLNLCDEIVGWVIDETLPPKMMAGEVDPQAFQDQVLKHFNLRWSESLETFTAREAVGQRLYALAEQAYQEKVTRYRREIFGQVEKYILLTTLDTLWKEHLLQMDHLKEGIGLRGYAQKEPLLEYKREAFQLFQLAMHHFAKDVVEKIFRVEIKTEEAAQAVNVAAAGRRAPPMMLAHQEVQAFGEGAAVAATAPAGPSASALAARLPSAPPLQSAGSYVGPRVGRNDPCPCGSGKKFKKCCGA